MQLKQSKIPGCYEILPKVFKDERGVFVKTFHEGVFIEKDLVTDFVEEYYTVSHKGVLRGMHFQTPPKDHTKLVYCLEGKVLDAIVDLRIGSPTYGQYETFEVSGEKANLIYIPPGLAHGFYVLSESAIMHYKVTTVYSQENDKGILWDSLGIPWHAENPILSKRDGEFPVFSQFKSPFSYQEEHCK